MRPLDEFEQGHIAGAVSAPLDEIRTWAREQAPKQKQSVAYCRGPYCVYAMRAVSELGRQGRRAIRSVAGVAEWRAAGYQMITGGAR